MMVVAGTVWTGHERRDGLDRAVEWLLIALLAFMPLAFGAVEAWSEEVVVALVSAICVLFVLKPVLRWRSPITWTWAYVPVAAFILVVMLQLLPLPPGLARLVSPNTVMRKSELLGDLADAREILSYTRITFYSHATRHDLRLVLAISALFVVVFNTYRRPDQIVRLLTAIAVIGGAVAVIAVVQRLLGNGMIYGFVPLPHDSADSAGPFVNHSHYAQFMNLSMGAALGLLFMKGQQDFTGRPLTSDAVANYLSSPDARMIWVLLGVVMLGAATVFASLSRGGVISMMFAGTLTTLVLSSRRSLRGPAWVMALLALGAFASVLYIGFDAVYDRLRTLGDLQEAESGRWQIVKDVAIAWTQFPILGTGLGTHEFVYPVFDRSTIPLLAAHAENEYAQAAEETGLAGLAALVVFGVLVVRSYVRTIRAKDVPVCAAALGLGFGLVAILVHSLSDFGQHLPANAALTAIFSALLIRLSRIGSAVDDAPQESAAISVRCRRRWIGCLVAVCALWAWVLPAADGARRAERHWRRALAAERHLADRDWEGTDADYTYLIDYARKATESDPGNVKYEHWLNVYRWRAISRVTDPNTGEIVIPAAGLEFSRRIAAELTEAVTLCPTFGPSWCVLGQLEKSVLGRHEEGIRHIRRGRELAPCDATACLVAGMLYSETGDVDAAFSEWQRAVVLQERLFEQVAALCIRDLERADLAHRLTDGRSRRLIWLEGTLDDLGGHEELVGQIGRELVALLEGECQAPDASAWMFAWLARRYRTEGRVDEAVAMYRKAVALDYSRVDWHFNLARLLAEKGVLPDAIRELQTCLRLRPQFKSAEELLGELSVRAGSGVR